MTDETIIQMSTDLTPFDDGELCQYIGNAPPVLWLNPDHPLVRRNCEGRGGDDRDFAWLLLGCYAVMNDLLDSVTNHHELEFQRRVTDTIAEFAT